MDGIKKGDEMRPLHSAERCMFVRCFPEGHYTSPISLH